jgi:hypothetical protein
MIEPASHRTNVDYLGIEFHSFYLKRELLKDAGAYCIVLYCIALVNDKESPLAMMVDTVVP